MYLHDFALLIAVSAPMAALFSVHSGLWAAGERETLLLPVMRAYPRAEMVDTLAIEFRRDQVRVAAGTTPGASPRPPFSAFRRFPVARPVAAA